MYEHVGPLYYRYFKAKHNVQFDSQGETVTYQEQQYYSYDAAKTAEMAPEGKKWDPSKGKQAGI